jgi:hypothetical protein
MRPILYPLGIVGVAILSIVASRHLPGRAPGECTDPVVFIRLLQIRTTRTHTEQDGCQEACYTKVSQLEQRY